MTSKDQKSSYQKIPPWRKDMIRFDEMAKAGYMSDLWFQYDVNNYNRRLKPNYRS